MTLRARIPHIDGLRGFAVILVVLHHFFPQTFKGGFIGVDVFFVISGFVIQKRLLAMSRFSFKEFYINRALRIFPALILILLVIILLAKYFYLDYPLRLLLNSSIASSIFATNNYFILNTGYFDVNSVSKPLLPLWSLAVEEQFYLIWPLIYWLFHKKFKRILIVAIALSLISALALGLHYENYNFYSLQTRFWEIAIGILAASVLVPSIKSGSSYYRSGLLIVLISLVFLGFTKETWPNLLAFLVVITTLIVILEPGEFIRGLLQNKFFQFFGKISFPLYLVHWPLLSFYSNMKPAIIPLIDKIFLLSTSVLLSFCIYHFLERNIQGIGGTTRAWTAGILTISLLASGLLSLELRSQLPPTSVVIRQSITSSNPIVKRNEWYFSGRSDHFQPTISNNCDYLDDIDMELSCVDGLQINPVDGLVVGDSKAEILFRALTRTNDEMNWGYLGGALKPIVPLATDTDEKKDPSIRISKWIAAQHSIKQVVIVSATRNLFNLHNDYSLKDMQDVRDFYRIKADFERWLLPLQNTGKQILIIRDNPTLRDPTYCHGVFSAFKALDRFTQTADTTPGCFYNLIQFNSDSSKYQRLLAQIELKYPNIKIVDSTDFLCSLARNRCELFRGNRLLYSYTDHLSDFAADYVANLVLASLRGSTL